MQRRTGQLRDRRLQSIEAVVQRREPWRRNATPAVSSSSVSTVDRGSFGPVLRSLTVARLRRFVPVFGLMPRSRLSCAREACDRCSAALTACPRQRARTDGAALARSRRSRDEPVPCGLLSIQRKDRTTKPWDQTPRGPSEGSLAWSPRFLLWLDLSRVVDNEREQVSRGKPSEGARCRGCSALRAAAPS